MNNGDKIVASEFFQPMAVRDHTGLTVFMPYTFRLIPESTCVVRSTGERGSLNNKHETFYRVFVPGCPWDLYVKE